VGSFGARTQFPVRPEQGREPELGEREGMLHALDVFGGAFMPGTIFDHFPPEADF
jgi:hypothetical protein